MNLPHHFVFLIEEPNDLEILIAWLNSTYSTNVRWVTQYRPGNSDNQLPAFIGINHVDEDKSYSTSHQPIYDNWTPERIINEFYSDHAILPVNALQHLDEMTLNWDTFLLAHYPECLI